MHEVHILSGQQKKHSSKGPPPLNMMFSSAEDYTEFTAPASTSKLSLPNWSLSLISLNSRFRNHAPIIPPPRSDRGIESQIPSVPRRGGRK
jgi:hypothetical protein